MMIINYSGSVLTSYLPEAITWTRFRIRTPHQQDNFEMVNRDL